MKFLKNILNTNYSTEVKNFEQSNNYLRIFGSYLIRIKKTEEIRKSGVTRSICVGQDMKMLNNSLFSTDKWKN